MKWEKFIQSGFCMPFYMNLYIEGRVEAVYRATGWHHPCSLVVIERQMNTVYESPETIKEYQRYVAPKLFQKKFRDRFIITFQKTDAALLKHCRGLYFQDYNHVGLPALGRDLRVFAELFRIKFGIYGLPKFTDLAINSILPELLSAALADKDLIILTKPLAQSEYTAERISFLKLVKEIRDRKLSDLFAQPHAEILDRLGRYYPDLYYRIETHIRTFAWISVSHLVQPLTFDQMLINLKIGLADATSEHELKEREREVVRTKTRQVTAYSRYSLNKQDRDILIFIQHLNEINESRKAAMSQAIFWSYPLFQALADRLAADIVSLRQLTARELAVAIKRGKLTGREQRLMRARLEYYVCLLKNGVIINASGAQARTLALRELGQTDYSAITELVGRVAQPGRVKGRVRLVLSEHQVEQLLPGEILITSMTDPDMVTAMKKAAAIVTDEGGITCHAAIVSRELKIPCVIGTKIATKVFKDGDRVEVDAGRGIVRKL